MKEFAEQVYSIYHGHRKKIIIMRNTAIILMISAFQVFATGSYSQTAQLSLKVKDATIKEVLSLIEDQSEFYFLYNSELIDVTRNVDVSVNNAQVDDVLARLFNTNEVDIVMKDRYIVLTPVGGESVQPGTFSGIVTDEADQPMMGVTIVIKGTTQGTITDSEGHFTLSNVPQGSVLVFSFVGMATQEIPLKDQTTLNITMVPDVIGIDEVVAVGYATQRKVNLTGSVVTVETESLETAAYTSTSSILQGKGSGVFVTQSSGEAGVDNATIRIRGIGTLNAGQSALVLVDGVAMDMNSVDPMDIESVSILKDAASAAIYGSRAANGVILITTKSGKKNQKVKVNYNTYYSISQVTDLPDMLNAFEHATLYNEAFTNDGLSPFFTDEEIAYFEDAIHVDDLDFPNNLSEEELAIFNSDAGYYQDVDYAKLYYGKGHIQKHYLSIQSGGEHNSTFFSLGYQDQQGVKRVGNWNTTYNARFNHETNLINDKLNIYANLRYLRDDYDRGSDNEAGHWTEMPWTGYYFPNGYYANEAGEIQAYKLGAINQNQRNQILGTIGTKIEPVKNLKINLDFSLLSNDVEGKGFSPFLEGYDVLKETVSASISSVEIYSRLSEKHFGNATVNYDFSMGGNHNFSLLAGSSFEDYLVKECRASRASLLNNFQPELVLGDASTMSNTSNAYDMSLASFFGRLNYNFHERYLLELNLRYDGSSRFDQGHQWGLFPSASVAWRITQESFAENWSAVNFLKMRFSYGNLGNQNIAIYAASDILNVDGIYPIGDQLVSVARISSLANKEISWETTTQYNAGIDFGFFRMFSGSFDVYNKLTKDALIRISVPATTGVGSGPYKNIAQVRNTGWDFNLNWRKAIAGQIMINAGMNISGYANEIVDLNSDTPYYFDYDKNTSSPKYVWMEGEAINSFLGYESGGIATQEDIDGGNLPTQLVTIGPGDLWYKDQTGDNVISAEDRIILGSPHPDFVYAFNLGLEYKGFDFSMLLQGAYGAETSTLDNLFRGDFRSVKNRPAFFLDRWTPENPDTYFPRVTLQSMKLPMSDYFIEDISYLRGKEITLGYTVPSKITRRIFVNSLRVYVNMINAFTLTNYRGLDPERPDPSSGASSDSVHPPIKTVSFGLQVQL